MEYLPLLLIAVLFWFLIIRPQRRRAAQQAQLVAGLEPGQDVVTAGGLHGRIESVSEDEVRLEIAPGTVVRVDRRAVSQLAPSAAETGDPR